MVRLCSLTVIGWMVAMVGCAHHPHPDVSQPTPEEEGWTRLGRIAVAQDSDQDIIATDHLAGRYQTLRFDADGPAQITRIGVTYENGSVFLPSQGVIFDKAGSCVLTLPRGHLKIDRVMLVYSGGRMFRKTRVDLWVR